MHLAESVKYGGLFQIDGKERAGELTLKGHETNLYVHDPEFFRPDAIEDRCILGVLNDRTRVSLLDSNAPPIPGSATVNDERYEFTDIFAHFVLHGPRHLSPGEAVVRSIHFVTDDARTIFYDFDAFGHVREPELFIRDLVRSASELTGREIPTGDLPEIVYFTGKREIFSAETALGTVSASHNPSSSWGGAGGVWIKNAISVDVRFPVSVVFRTAIEAVSTILLFLELVAGRRQNIEEVSLLIDSPDETVSRVNLYWSMPPRRDHDIESRRPQPGDLPLNGGINPVAFGEVLKQWLLRQNTWGEARSRFSTSFSQQNSYLVDRIVGSANMFDLLPADAVPKDVPLGPELIRARDEAKALFRKLPQSGERDSVLGALGRVGQASLTAKIQHRAQSILAICGDKLPGLAEVLALAVNCRNHYVHGSPPKVDYSTHFFETVPFLSNSLEFVFAASDLIDAGWDLAAFTRQGTTMSHPLGAYLVSYSGALSTLNALLPEGGQIGGS